jgi:hypothetical protein
MDDALGGHLVHHRNGLAERRLGALHVVIVERRANGLQGRAERGAQLTVVLPALDILAICFEGGLGTLGHDTEILSGWSLLPGARRRLAASTADKTSSVARRGKW